MTSAQTLRAARELMLAQHGPGCPDHAVWVDLADLMAKAEATPASESARFALVAANTYLAATKEHAHG